MDKIFEVYIDKAHAPDSAASARLKLPATAYELLDALEKLRCTDADELYVDVTEYLDCEELSGHLDGRLDIFSLNALAGRIAAMGGTDYAAFMGLTEMDTRAGGMLTVDRLLDLACSTDRCHVVGEALNDSQLGRFYAENGFIREVESVSDEVFELLDFEKLGRERRMAEHGLFTSCGYVMLDGMLRKAPAVERSIMKPNYVFRLTLDRIDPESENHMGLNVPLELPADERVMRSALAQLQTDRWEGTVMTALDGPLPDFADALCFMDDLPQLNELAGMVRQLDADGNLPRFKAALDATGCPNVDTALHLAAHLDEYLLDAAVSGPVEMAKSELDFLLPDGETAALIERHMDLYAYGRELLQQQNAALTPYGLVVRRDNEPLQAMEEGQEEGMRMV